MSCSGISSQTNQPGWRWVWTRRHTLGSSDSEGCLNIYCRLHTLFNRDNTRGSLPLTSTSSYVNCRCSGRWKHQGKMFNTVWTSDDVWQQCNSPFGWNILETNRTVGGLLGYSSENSIRSLNVPADRHRKREGREAQRERGGVQGCLRGNSCEENTDLMDWGGQRKWRKQLGY